MESPTTSPLKSRLEINFIRLLDETQQMANGNKPKDWSFNKFIEDRRLAILYGSETGTAQEVSERIGREAKRYYFKTKVSSMNSISMDEFMLYRTVVFVAATTGQGDDPENMKTFFKTLWSLRKTRHLLNHLSFAVLGLGDSSYQKFNFSAKRLNNLLSYLSGSALLKIGLADDQHDLGPDFVVDSWLKEFWKILLQKFPLPVHLEPIATDILPISKFKVKFIDNISNLKQDPSTKENKGNIFSQNDPYFATVSSNTKMTSSDHFQDVRLIEFDIPGLGSYSPGEVLMVQPTNLDEYVDEFISVLGLNPHREFSLELNDENSSLPLSYILPSPCTVRTCVKHYFDFMSVPKRYFFELLSFFTTDEQEKEKFLEFCSSQGQQDLYDYCNRPKRSIMEVLADFSFTRSNIPFEYLFDLIPPIKPRAYSIASSCKSIPGKVQILAAVVNYKTTLKRPRLGLCTNWLAQLSNGEKLPLWIKSGTFKFPNISESNSNSAVIMIGPGTGCAPFRAFIEESVAMNSSSHLIMFYGCRNKCKDYFFKEEWEKLVEASKLELYTAFSRDQEDKVYVQHLMRENAEYLFSYLCKKNTTVFFAGNAKRVPIDIYEALVYICMKGMDVDEEKAQEYMKKDLEKRYQTETWA